MKSILVPTDFSDCSASAYSYAVSLAQRSGATIYLLHILEVSFPSLALGGEEETTADTQFMMHLMKATKAQMQKVRGREEFKNVQIKELIEVGPVPDRMYHTIETHNIDMVVMGTHGTSGLQEKFIGTNAEKVVRNVSVPVLSVKHTVQKPKVDTMMFATDFSEEADLVLPMVSDIADLFGAKLALMKVITPNKYETTDQTEEEIRKFRLTHKMTSYSADVYYSDSKEEGIRRAAESTGADMIALGTHGRHGLAHFFRGSVAEDVVSHASMPVLTINFPDKQVRPQVPVQNEKNHQYDSDLLYQIPSV